MHGKMYVRGYDREGRPIIHYRPGLEKSFDTEKVSIAAAAVRQRSAISDLRNRGVKGRPGTLVCWR